MPEEPEVVTEQVEARAVTDAAGAPRAGHVEQRSAPGDLHIEGKRLHGVIPYGIESRDLGGWREQMAPGSLNKADLNDLVVTVDHAGVPVGRYPNTLQLEDRSDGLHWSVELPDSRNDVREAVQRGDLKASSWRMVVGRDSWDGDLRTVQEVRALKDVAVVTTPAYPSATAELRSVTEAAEPEEPEQEAAMPEQKGGGLTVEARSADADRDIETRVLEAIRSVPPGESRSLTTASASAIDTPELATYIFDKLRPNSVMLASGITTMTTDRESVVWPATVTDAGANWTAEGDDITESDPAWDQITVTPSKLAALITASNESLDDAPIDLLGWLQNHLLKILGLKLDINLLEGTQTSGLGIVGLKNQSGINVQYLSSDTGNGATLSNLDAISTGIGTIEANNATPTAIVMRPTTWTTIEQLKDANGRYLVTSEPSAASPRSLFGLPVFTTSALSSTETRGSASNTSSVYVYDSSQVVLVRRADVQVEVDRSQLFSSDQTQIRAKLRVGSTLPHPSAVVRIAGIKPS